VSLRRHIRRVFQLKRTRPPALEHPSPEHDGTLASLGYPTLQQVDFFLGPAALERWRAERTLAFPPGCCVCLKEATRALPARADAGWLGLGRREHIVEQVPHCELHGSGDEARLIASVDVWSDRVLRVSLIGLQGAFLEETAKRHRTEEVPPPWWTFPQYSSVSSGWRQGYGEAWIGQAWYPFWRGLSEAERAKYLERWSPPEDWRELLG